MPFEIHDIFYMRQKFCILYVAPVHRDLDNRITTFELQKYKVIDTRLEELTKSGSSAFL